VAPFGIREIPAALADPASGFSSVRWLVLAPRLQRREVTAMPRRSWMLFTPAGWMMVLSAGVTLCLVAFACQALR
jgi:hypothetical protein